MFFISWSCLQIFLKFERNLLINQPNKETPCNSEIDFCGDLYYIGTSGSKLLFLDVDGDFKEYFNELNQEAEDGEAETTFGSILFDMQNNDGVDNDNNSIYVPGEEGEAKKKRIKKRKTIKKKPMKKKSVKKKKKSVKKKKKKQKSVKKKLKKKKSVKKKLKKKKSVKKKSVKKKK